MIILCCKNFENFFECVWLGTGVAYCISSLLTKARKEFLVCKTIRTTVVAVKYIGPLSQCRLLLLVIFFLDTLAICISPALISFLFAFRFPVIHFENFCLAVKRLGS